MQGEFGSRWRKTFHKILGEAAIEIWIRLDELEPEKAPEDRRKVLTQLASFCALNTKDVLNGAIVSKKAMQAAGYDEDSKGDTRIVWLLTAAAYVALASVLAQAGRDAAAMHFLMDAKYWIGFQNSGDLRKFVEEGTISSIHQRERNSKYAKLKHAKEAERYATMMAQIREFVQQRRDWPTRSVFIQEASASLIAANPAYFSEISRGIEDEADKADKVMKESERLAKRGYNSIDDPDQYFKRRRTKRTSQ
ncbi:hypothetical protein [Variovorax guangxiensis]|nr:hypothetical protein [Variovorax guangxiensis]